jgi:hypothetical protein
MKAVHLVLTEPMGRVFYLRSGKISISEYSVEIQVGMIPANIFQIIIDNPAAVELILTVFITALHLRHD